jgi:hypothetical protein
MVTLKSLIPKRRWLRFSLSTFLLAVAVIAYGCKWALHRVKLCAGQYDLLASITVRPDIHHLVPPVPDNVGGGNPPGGVHYAFAAPTGWEKEMADWLGIRYEIDVVHFQVYSPRIDLPHDVEIALRLPKLKNLGIHGEPIGDDIISACKRMKWLERLALANTDVTEETAAALKRALPNTEVSVYRYNQRSVVTDEGSIRGTPR